MVIHRVVEREPMIVRCQFTRYLPTDTGLSTVNYKSPCSLVYEMSATLTVSDLLKQIQCGIAVCTTQQLQYKHAWYHAPCFILRTLLIKNQKHNRFSVCLKLGIMDGCQLETVGIVNRRFITP